MKKSIYLLFLLVCSALYSAAQWTNKTMSFNGTNRQYRVYLPAGYNAANTYPLVMTLHGLGDNMNNFSGIGMNTIADTAKFIVVVPQAITDPMLGAAAWNSGAGMLGIYPNANVNDIGFLSALLDTVSATYTINQARIYVCGFSMGGYMTQKLGCALSNKIAAIASVSGTIGNGAGACNPVRVLPVLHMHGTNDETVPYTNNNSGIDADSLVKFWVKKNNCNTTPVHVAMPDIAGDGLTVDHYTYTGNTPQAVAEHFRVNGGGHIWLTQNNDISYSVEIWRFFRRYQLTQPTGIPELGASSDMRMSPNPAAGYVHIETPFATSRLRLYTMNGSLLLERDIKREVTLSLDGISNGVYVLQCSAGGQSCFRKIIIEN